MKRTLTALAFTLISLTGFAQQDIQVSQNMFNRLAPNPAFAGSSGAYCGTLLYRNQWNGFQGAPQTGVLTLDADLQQTFLHGGVGLNVASDRLGNEKSIIADVSYAYRMLLGNGSIALGVKAGILQKSFITDFNPLQSGDAAIPTPGVSALVPDFSAGVYYNTRNLYFGISSTHLSKPTLEYSAAVMKLDLARHYYVMAGYDYELNPKIDLKPSVLIKSDASSTQLDVNLNVMYDKFIWAGASYRLTDAVVAMIGLQLSQGLKFGYAYDITTSNLKGYSNGSHEIMIGYCYKPVKTKKFKVHKNVRFL